MVVDHWFRQVKRILEAMEITFDAMRIRLVMSAQKHLLQTRDLARFGIDFIYIYIYMTLFLLLF